jgi:hypothetical protein
MGIRDKRYAKVFPNNEKLRKIIAEHGEYFEVVSSPEIIPQLQNQLGMTLRDENITFTTQVQNSKNDSNGLIQKSDISIKAIMTGFQPVDISSILICRSTLVQACNGCITNHTIKQRRVYNRLGIIFLKLNAHR